MQYVYRYYISGRGNINQRWLYVGIAKDLHRRIKQHESDKLSRCQKMFNCSIQYVAVNSRFDADALETYLIGLHKPIYNEAKKDFDRDQMPTFLGDAVEQMEWCNYLGKDFPLCNEPFEMKSVGYIYGIEKQRQASEAVWAAISSTDNDNADDYGLPAIKETKSKRLQLLIRPSTDKALTKEAKRKRISKNELINQILEARRG